jgi:hypothetical protein
MSGLWGTFDVGDHEVHVVPMDERNYHDLDEPCECPYEVEVLFRGALLDGGFLVIHNLFGK